MVDYRGHEIKEGQLVAYCIYGERTSEIYLGTVIGFTAQKVRIKKINDHRRDYYTFDDNQQIESSMSLLKYPEKIVIVEEPKE